MLTLKALGVTFQKLGHIEKAAELLEYSLELYIKVYSEKSPSYAHPCSYLSVIHHQLGNFTRSKEMADTLYKILCNGADVPVGPGMLGTSYYCSTCVCLRSVLYLTIGLPWICVMFNYRTSMDLCYI